MSASPLLSIVSPVFQAEQIVPELAERILEEAQRVTEDFEVILVEDGSPDRSWNSVIQACALDPRVQGVRLTRNFGQQNAITAGLTFARGRYVVVMDCDLQDDPRYIPALVAKAREGYDVVVARGRTRAHSWLRNIPAHAFYLLLKITGDIPRVDTHVHGYSVISRRVVDAFLRLEDYRRDYLMLVQWMGFRQAVLPVEHASRFAGVSSYTWAKLMRHAAAAFAAHSKSMLKLAVAFGFAYVVAAAVSAAYLVINYFVHGYRAGWASTMVMILVSTGFILLSIGVAGIYIGNVFDQVRRRPLFLVQETVNPPVRPQGPGSLNGGD